MLVCGYNVSQSVAINTSCGSTDSRVYKKKVTFTLKTSIIDYHSENKYQMYRIYQNMHICIMYERSMSNIKMAAKYDSYLNVRTQKLNTTVANNLEQQAYC